MTAAPDEIAEGFRTLIQEAMFSFGADVQNADMAGKLTIDHARILSVKLHERITRGEIGRKLDAMIASTEEPTEEQTQELMYLAHMAGHEIFREMFAN